MARQLADRILEYLGAHGETNSLDLADEFREDHQKIVGAIKSLETVDNVSFFFNNGNPYVDSHALVYFQSFSHVRLN